MGDGVQGAATNVGKDVKLSSSRLCKLRREDAMSGREVDRNRVIFDRIQSLQAMFIHAKDVVLQHLEVEGCGHRLPLGFPRLSLKAKEAFASQFRQELTFLASVNVLGVLEHGLESRSPGQNNKRSAHNLEFCHRSGAKRVHDSLKGRQQ